eukprot:m.108213 g.108213  ORF g.108213 m.108213 type:complete len:514 (+) comp19082_c0_seq3:314-1855(+)
MPEAHGRLLLVAERMTAAAADVHSILVPDAVVGIGQARVVPLLRPAASVVGERLGTAKLAAGLRATNGLEIRTQQWPHHTQQQPAQQHLAPVIPARQHVQQTARHHHHADAKHKQVAGGLGVQPKAFVRNRGDHGLHHREAHHENKENVQQQNNHQIRGTVRCPPFAGVRLDNAIARTFPKANQEYEKHEAQCAKHDETRQTVLVFRPQPQQQRDSWPCAKCYSREKRHGLQAEGLLLRPEALPAVLTQHGGITPTPHAAQRAGQIHDKDGIHKGIHGITSYSKQQRQHQNHLGWHDVAQRASEQRPHQLPHAVDGNHPCVVVAAAAQLWPLGAGDFPPQNKKQKQKIVSREEGVREKLAVVQAPGRVALQQPFQEIGQARGNARWQRHFNRSALQTLLQSLHRTLCKETLARQALVGNGANTPQIRLEIVFATVQKLFRGHVQRRSAEIGSHVAIIFFEREVEICNFNLQWSISVGHQKILRLQIQVTNVLCVHVLQCSSHLPQHQSQRMLV